MKSTWAVRLRRQEASNRSPVETAATTSKQWAWVVKALTVRELAVALALAKGMVEAVA